MQKTITKSKKNENIIHCIGDSHVNFFSGNDFIQPIWPEYHKDKICNFKTYRLGSYLAYSLAKKNSESTKKLNKLINLLPPKSKLLFSYGEIDCRVHLMKQSILQKKDLKSVVNECVDGYFLEFYHLKVRGMKL